MLNLLAAELLASSLVADLHLIPAFMVLTFIGDEPMATSLAIGAVVANIFSIALALIESAKVKIRKSIRNGIYSKAD